MKPHPRIRKTIKWGSAAVTVLLVVAWIGSGWGNVWQQNENGLRWSFGHGLVDFGNTGGMHETFGLHAEISHFYVGRGICLPNYESDDAFPGEWYCTLPLWTLAVGSAITTGFAWRPDLLARVRAKLNLCPKCGYDRTGLLQDAKCPECGAAPRNM
jgi:hypothetical protein